MDIGSIFKDVAGIAIQAGLTYLTGNPAIGQLAHQAFDSAVNQSGSTNNAAFNQIFNANIGTA